MEASHPADRLWPHASPIGALNRLLRMERELAGACLPTRADAAADAAGRARIGMLEQRVVALGGRPARRGGVRADEARPGVPMRSEMERERLLVETYQACLPELDPDSCSVIARHLGPLRRAVAARAAPAAEAPPRHPAAGAALASLAVSMLALIGGAHAGARDRLPGHGPTHARAAAADRLAGP